jgi:hypothetical protein
VFSLWRAVFLIHKSQTKRRLNEPEIDTHARLFLLKVIETNTILFGDDVNYREWSGGYYVNNAWYRVTEIRTGRASSFEGPMKLQDAWDKAFADLEKIITGTNGGDNASDAPGTGIVKRRNIRNR